MTIKYLREILKHYEGHEYDDWQITLWDYNNQRYVKWEEGMYAASKDKYINFPVEVPPFDGESLDERLKRLIEESKKDEK